MNDQEEIILIRQSEHCVHQIMSRALFTEQSLQALYEKKQKAFRNFISKFILELIKPLLDFLISNGSRNRLNYDFYFLAANNGGKSQRVSRPFYIGLKICHVAHSM